MARSVYERYGFLQEVVHQLLDRKDSEDIVSKCEITISIR